MNTTEAPFQAIPTIYNGVQLKSRFEAQCALLLDRVGWEWVYEPISIMLPTGVAYQPDFFLPKYGVYIETRGYHTKRGQSQIDSFASLVASNLLVDGLNSESPCRYFVAITEGDAGGVKYGDDRWTRFGIAYCPDCNLFVPVFDSHEPSCVRCDCKVYFESWLSAESGKILAGGSSLEGSSSTRWNASEARCYWYTEIIGEILRMACNPVPLMWRLSVGKNEDGEYCLILPKPLTEYSEKHQRLLLSAAYICGATKELPK